VGRIRSRSVSELLLRKADLSGDLVWLVTDHELGTVKDSGKFDPPDVLRTLAWPDGRPGFHAVRLRYLDRVGTADNPLQGVSLDGELSPVPPTVAKWRPPPGRPGPVTPVCGKEG